jgi:RNA polymerase sigma factor (sigma-70 family)
MTMEPNQNQRLTSEPAVMAFIEDESFRMMFGRVLADWRVDRHEKEDIRQELIMSMLKAAKQPDGIKSAPHYINRAVTLILKRTREKRGQRAASQLPHDLATFGAEPVAEAIARQDQRAVVAAIACLDRNDRILCNLKEFGYSDSNLKAVAEQCGQSIATVHRRKKDAREKLKFFLQDEKNLRNATSQMVEHHPHTIAGVHRWRPITLYPQFGDKYSQLGGILWPTVHVVEPGRAIVYTTIGPSTRNLNARFFVSALPRPWFAPDAECVWEYSPIRSDEYDVIMRPKHAETLRRAECMPAGRWEYPDKGDIRFKPHLCYGENNELGRYLNELQGRYKQFMDAGHTARQFYALHGLTREGIKGNIYSSDGNDDSTWREGHDME